MTDYFDPNFEPDFDSESYMEPRFDVINIDTNDLVETFDAIEDARELIKIHPDAENLAILHVTHNDAQFVD